MKEGNILKSTKLESVGRQCLIPQMGTPTIMDELVPHLMQVTYSHKYRAIDILATSPPQGPDENN
jgi:hypothetical protein